MAKPLHVAHSARKAQYLDPRWQKKRLEILSRDNFTCQCCGASDKTLHVHHVYYTKWAEGPWDYINEALISLCNECHEKEGEELPDAKEMLFAGLVELGFNTAQKIQDFAHFLDLVRCGCTNPNERQDAADFIVSVWEKHGAFQSEGNQNGTH